MERWLAMGRERLYSLPVSAGRLWHGAPRLPITQNAAPVASSIPSSWPLARRDPARRLPVLGGFDDAGLRRRSPGVSSLFWTLPGDRDDHSARGDPSDSHLPRASGSGATDRTRSAPPAGRRRAKGSPNTASERRGKSIGYGHASIGYTHGCIMASGQLTGKPDSRNPLRRPDRRRQLSPCRTTSASS
jgi:hypothetical protein